MGSSPEYQKFAELYYERNRPIVNAYIRQSEGVPEGVVVFDDEDWLYPVVGKRQDFLNTVQNLVPTVRDGVKQLIDVRDTAASDPDTYLRNLEFFHTEDDDAILTATRKINQGEISPPSEFDSKNAVEASIRLDFSNEDLRKLIKNYTALLAVMQSDANRMNPPYRNYREEASYDEERFDEVYETAVELLQEEYLNGPPLACYRDWEEIRKTDLLNFSSRLLKLKTRKEIEWENLKSREKSTKPGDAYFRFWQNKTENIKMGKIEGEYGIERILEQYAELFELAREPLQDIAAALDGSGSVDLSDTADVLRFLDSNNQQSFTELIEPQLRHGSSHASIEADDSTATLKIYDGRGQNRKVVKSIDYQDAPFAYYRLSDMVAGLLFAITRVDDRVVLRYLSSPEFRLRMVENIPPEEFSQ